MNESEVREIVCRKFLDGDTSFPLEADSQLLDEGICDSLGLVQLAADIEKRVPGLIIRDQDVTRQNFGSIGSIVRFIASKKK